MKKLFAFIFLTMLLGGKAFADDKNYSKEADGMRFVKKFYVEYLVTIQDGTLETLRDDIISPSYSKDLENHVREAGYDLIIRGQDANESSSTTVSVTPKGNRWYVVTYLKGYGDESTSIPVRLTTVDGTTRIDRILVEGENFPATIQPKVQTPANEYTDITTLKTFYEKYLRQIATDAAADCRSKYLTFAFHLDVLRSRTDNERNVFVCGVARASESAPSTVKVSNLKNMYYLVTFTSDGKQYKKKIHVATVKGRLAIDSISDVGQ